MPSIFEPRPPAPNVLPLHEIGIASGGALLVYLSAGDRLPDGRKKYDPSLPDDDVLLHDMEGIWALGVHLDEWAANPAAGPQLLLAIHGPTPARHIVASARTDTTRWSDQSLQDLETKRWNVPLEQPVNLNANSLRRRRVDGIRFRQNPTHWHIWVDAEGVQRHPDT